MTRSATVIALAIVLAAAAVVVAYGRAARVEAADAHKIVYLHVTGRGGNARAWFFSAPPSGVLVQEALDKFAGEGFHYVAISSSGVAAQTASSTTPAGDSSLDASYVILLER
jgi:hypothetical protein